MVRWYYIFDVPAQCNNVLSETPSIIHVMNTDGIVVYLRKMHHNIYYHSIVYMGCWNVAFVENIITLYETI